jgi:hypothetical protein
MIEFIQKQIEASERLFEMMRSDHDTRMKEMEHWARTTQSLIEKLHERDMTIDMLKNGKNVSSTDTNVPKNETEDVAFREPRATAQDHGKAARSHGRTDQAPEG